MAEELLVNLPGDILNMFASLLLTIQGIEPFYLLLLLLALECAGAKLCLML